MYAPDQLKKGHPKAFKIAGVLVAIVLILLVRPTGILGERLGRAA